MLPYIPAIAVAMLLLLAIPVYLPRTALVLDLAIIAGGVFFLTKPVVPSAVKFNWGLDVPLGVALLLYAALWLFTAIVSIRDARVMALQAQPA